MEEQHLETNGCTNETRDKDGKNTECDGLSPVKNLDNSNSSSNSSGSVLNIDVSPEKKNQEQKPKADGQGDENNTLDKSSSVSISFLSSSDNTSPLPNGTTTEVSKSSFSITSSDDISFDSGANKDTKSSQVAEAQVTSNCDTKDEVKTENQDKLKEKEESLPGYTNQCVESQTTNPLSSNVKENQNDNISVPKANDILEGRDEDSLVAARLMTNLARGNLPFPQLAEKDLTELQVTTNNALSETHVTDTQAVLYNEQLLNVADSMAYSHQEHPLDFRSSVNQNFQTFTGGMDTTSMPQLPSFNSGFGQIPLDAVGQTIGQWNQSDLRRNSYGTIDMSLGHPQASSTPQEARSDSSLPWDPSSINQVFPSPFQTESNQIWNGLSGTVTDSRHLQPDPNYEALLPPLPPMGTRANPTSVLFNPGDIPGQDFLAGSLTGPQRFSVPQPRHFEQDAMNFGPLDYRMIANAPQFFPIPNGPSNIPIGLDYMPRFPNRDVGEVEKAYQAKHKYSYDMDREVSPAKRRRRTRYSRKTSGLGGSYPDLTKSLVFGHNNKGCDASEILHATKHLQQQNDLYNKQERYFVIISPEVNPAEVKSISHKGLLAKYIDYLIVENEQITEMSKSVSIPVDNFVCDDPYLSDIIKVKVPFPSQKYIHWLKTYYPNIQVDWKGIQKNNHHSGGDYRSGRTFLIDQRPLPLLLRESFFFFQSEKNKKDNV